MPQEAARLDVAGLVPVLQFGEEDGENIGAGVGEDYASNSQRAENGLSLPVRRYRRKI